jgi:sec-independent protein translocase protein TatA
MISTSFLSIGTPEILVILLFVLMVFGADKIPEIARGLGKGIRQVKDATNDIKKEINESAKLNNLDSNVKEDITKGVKEVKDKLDDFTGPIKRSK